MNLSLNESETSSAQHTGSRSRRHDDHRRRRDPRADRTEGKPAFNLAVREDDDWTRIFLSTNPNPGEHA